MYPISLSAFQEIDFLSLDPQLLFTNRRDTKFIFHYHDWPGIMEGLIEDYCLVLHEGKASQTYSTIYYDSVDLKYYMAHHNGHGNRVKIRTRTYQNGNSFFETKLKTNTGITIKERSGDTQHQVDGLIPQLEVQYDRITLYDRRFQEKLTFDFNLNFQHEVEQVQFSGLVIAESKKLKTTHSPFIQALKKRKFEPASVSKYCLGLASLNKSIKQNNFKSLMHTIKKINSKYDVPSTC